MSDCVGERTEEEGSCRGCVFLLLKGIEFGTFNDVK